jgi:DNA replication protein DnaC
MSLPQQIRLQLGLGSTPEQRLLAAARRLANDISTREAAALARLVADSGDTRAADVGFAQPALLYWRTDGGQNRGSLSKIHVYYQELGRGRLVIQGPAGAGKTVLAIALTCELARRFLVGAENRDTASDPNPRLALRSTGMRWR